MKIHRPVKKFKPLSYTRAREILLSALRTVGYDAGADPGFQVRGAHLKKLRRAEGGAKIFGVFRVKNHDFTPQNHIFSNFRGGGRAGCAPPPWIRPCDESLYGYMVCIDDSLRRGGVSAAAKNNVSDRLLRAHGRWASDRSKDGYIQDELYNKLLVSRNLDL